MKMPVRIVVALVCLAASTFVSCKRKTLHCPPVISGILADTSSWKITGATTYDPSDQALHVTTATMHQTGSAFYTAQTAPANDINVTFEFRIGGGDGGDGFALVALDSTQPGGYFGADGCGLGFGSDISCTSGPPLKGWAVEFDTYYNASVDQTQGPHIAFSVDGDLRNEPFWAEVSDLRDDKWHQMSVTLKGKHLSAKVDGYSYMEGDLLTEPKFDAWIGFTGSTGQNTDDHFIRDLKIVTADCAVY